MKARTIRVRTEENSWLAGMRIKASAEWFPLDKRWRNYAQGQRRISFIKLIRPEGPMRVLQYMCACVCVCLFVCAHARASTMDERLWGWSRRARVCFLAPWLRVKGAHLRLVDFSTRVNTKTTMNAISIDQAWRTPRQRPRSQIDQWTHAWVWHKYEVVLAWYSRLQFSIV